MNPDVFLSIAGPNVIHEDFGDEMVVVHLETGRYYSFNQTGAEIWNQVSTGIRIADLMSWAAEKFSGENGRMESEVMSFLDQLKEEELVAESPAPVSPVSHETPSEEKIPFLTPAMEKFTDMQDLLLLDPIHEVDDAGWPHPAEGNDGGKSE